MRLRRLVVVAASAAVGSAEPLGWLTNDYLIDRRRFARWPVPVRLRLRLRVRVRPIRIINKCACRPERGPPPPPACVPTDNKHKSELRRFRHFDHSVSLRASKRASECFSRGANVRPANKSIGARRRVVRPLIPRCPARALAAPFTSRWYAGGHSHLARSSNNNNNKWALSSRLLRAGSLPAIHVELDLFLVSRRVAPRANPTQPKGRAIARQAPMGRAGPGRDDVERVNTRSSEQVACALAQVRPIIHVQIHRARPVLGSCNCELGHLLGCRELWPASGQVSGRESLTVKQTQPTIVAVERGESDCAGLVRSNRSNLKVDARARATCAPASLAGPQKPSSG
ncbi:Hypothetical predicted protein [Olea europaea subsp. europaea]|uniref:Secreted protein n=1 Tax=Olea europaea subsp. europaea TaxID=158383 RepID=A0A8S0TNK3_OLEEU|nr:Hypothetical predicted protein [Olea europaea subsp. europaea]